MKFIEREIRPGVSTVIVPIDEEWTLVECVPINEEPSVTLDRVSRGELPPMIARFRVTRRPGYGPWILRLWDRLTGRCTT